MSRRQGTLKDKFGDGRTWVVRLSFGVGESGSRIRKTITIHGTKAEAQRVLNGWAAQKDAGETVTLSRQTLGQWIAEWLGSFCAHQTQRTREDSRALLDRYLPDELRARRLTTLRRAHVAAWVRSLSARGLGPRTVRMAHGALRACLNSAVEDGRLSKNVAAHFKQHLPALPHREMSYLTSEQAYRLIRAAEGTRWGAFLVLLTTTGLRPGEALALKWSDLDMEKGRLTVQRARSRVSGGYVIGATKTKNKRTVGLDDLTLAALRHHRVRQWEWQTNLGDLWQENGLVFASDYGTVADPTAIAKNHFKPLLKAVGLPDIRLYDLRHTAATLLFAAGEDMKVVQDRLGHASITLTLNTYTHVADEVRARTAARLGDLWKEVELRAATASSPTSRSVG